MALQKDNLVVVGGLTGSCASDGVAHSLNLDGSSWTSASPGALRRRHGASAVPMDDNKVIVVGGIADKRTCSNDAVAYTGVDSMTVPVTSSTSVSSSSLPSSLTGSKLAVSDFAMATTGSTVYLAGGQAADGSLVPLDTVGVWTSSGGWTSQKLTGDVPAGRLGATLVAHPTLDLLVLHGGSEYDSSSSSYSPSSVLATLNTKTWEWSQPSNLKSSSGVAYHTSVMTPSGVMITAFGKGSSGSLVSDVHYLDMRDATTDSWAWKSEWDNSMLTKIEMPPNAQANESDHKSNSGKTAAIAVPVVLGTLILIPLCFWLWRKYQRNERKRRLASHFSFSTQEDNGHFRDFDGGRRNRSMYPFGRDESSEGSWGSNMRTAIGRVFRRGSSAHGVGDDGTIASREMVQVSPAELAEKNWEEIDFGLGRVDEGRREATYTDLPARRNTPRASMPRRNSFEHPGSPHAEQIPFPMPIASTLPYAQDEPENEKAASTGTLIDIDQSSPRLGSPRTDGQSQLLSPALEQPAQSPFADPVPAQSGLSAAAEDAASVDDWNALAKSIETRPAFRPLSPTATLGSHHHASGSTDSHASDSSFSTAPSLPPMDFTGSPMLKNATLSSRTGTVASARSRVPSGPGRHLAGGRRVSGASERRVSGANPNRLSPLRVVNGDEQ